MKLHLYKIIFLIYFSFNLIYLSNSQNGFFNKLDTINGSYIFSPISLSLSADFGSQTGVDLSYLSTSVTIRPPYPMLLDLTSFSDPKKPITFVLNTVYLQTKVFLAKDIIDTNPSVYGLSDLHEGSIPIIDSNLGCHVSYVFKFPSGTGNSYSILQSGSIFTTMLQPDIYWIDYFSPNVPRELVITNLNAKSLPPFPSQSLCAVYEDGYFNLITESASAISVPFQLLDVAIFKTDKQFSTLKVQDTNIPNPINLRPSPLGDKNLYTFPFLFNNATALLLRSPAMENSIAFNNSLPFTPQTVLDTSINVTISFSQQRINILEANMVPLVDQSVSILVDIILLNYSIISQLSYSCNNIPFLVDPYITQANYSKSINIPSQFFSSTPTLQITAIGESLNKILYSKSLQINGDKGYNYGISGTCNAVNSTTNIDITSGFVDYFHLPHLDYKSIFLFSRIPMPPRKRRIEYPYHFYGNLNAISTKITDIMYSDEKLGSYVMQLNFENDTRPFNVSYGQSSNNNETLDLVNPLVSINVTFNQDYINITYLININDTVGIYDNSCKISLGNTINLINSSNRIKGDYKNGQYLIISKYNLAYCYEPISLICSDRNDNLLNISTISPFNNLIFNYTIPSACSDIRPIQTSIKYQSPLSLSYYIVMYYNITAPVGKIILSNDRDGNDVIRTDNLWKIDDNSNGLAVYSFNYSFKDTNRIASYFPSICFESLNIYYSNNDLSYFLDKTSCLEIKITPTTYKPFKLPTMSISASLISMTIPLNSYQISFVGLVYLNSLYPEVNRLSWQLPDGDTNNVEKSVTLNITNFALGAGYFVYIEKVCNVIGNCEDLPAHGVFINQLWNRSINTLPLPPPAPKQFNITMISFTNYIDTSSSNRLFSAKINIYPTLINTPPVLYLVSGRFDMVKCNTSFYPASNGTNLVCSTILPPGWGANSLVELSLHRMFYNNSFSFQILPSVLIIPPSTGPRFWSATYNLISKKISLTGYDLGYLGSDSLYPIKLNNSTLTFRIKNATSGSIDLTLIQLSPTSEFNISCSGVDYLVTIEPLACGHGTFATSNSTCVCDEGWSGLYCDTANNKFFCGENGIYISMACQCANNTIGPKCDITNDLKMKMEMNKTLPRAKFSEFESANIDELSKNTAMTMEIFQIVELDSNNNAVNTYQPAPADWKLSLDTEGQYQYWVYVGTGNLTVTVNIFKNETLIQWLNSTLSMPANTFKFTVSLKNYPFESSSNRLQLKWLMNSTSADNGRNDTDSGYGGKQDDVHWSTLSNNQIQLYSRFNNKISLDGQEYDIKFEIINSSQASQIVVATIPWFSSGMEMDPDFSTLTRFKSDSSGGDNSVDYRVAIIIVVVVVFIAALVTVAILLVKKNTLVRTKILAIKNSRGHKKK